MELDKMLAIMAAPIYAELRRQALAVGDPALYSNELRSQAVEEAKKLWIVAHENARK